MVVIGSALVETFFKQGVDETIEKIKKFAKILRDNK